MSTTARCRVTTGSTTRSAAPIIGYHEGHPLEGYRRLTFMMLDEDVAAVSPASVYRVLSAAEVTGDEPRAVVRDDSRSSLWMTFSRTLQDDKIHADDERPLSGRIRRARSFAARQPPRGQIAPGSPVSLRPVRRTAAGWRDARKRAGARGA